jgi:hypothetical protein
MFTIDRIILDCLSMVKKTQSTQDPIKRMPPGGCALFEGSHHKYKIDEKLEK